MNGKPLVKNHRRPGHAFNPRYKAADVAAAGRTEPGHRHAVADNRSQYVNHCVANMLDKLKVKFTHSRPRHSNDNRLAENKNGAVVRKEFGFAQTSRNATRFSSYCAALARATTTRQMQRVIAG